MKIFKDSQLTLLLELGDLLSLVDLGVEPLELLPGLDGGLAVEELHGAAVELPGRPEVVDDARDVLAVLRAGAQGGHGVQLKARTWLGNRYHYNFQ